MILRDYQEEAISSLYEWFEKNDGGGVLLSLPTGSGKSILVAKICEDALAWPTQRVIVLSHVKELIQQNMEKLIKLWPDAPVGVYSAGLDSRDGHHAITMATIQSVYKKPNVIGWRSLCIIDECHLLSDSEDGMYRQLIESLRIINPQMKVIGLSATIFRTKTGMLHVGDKAMFDGVAYDLPIVKLMKSGWLCPLISKASVVQGDTEKIGIQGGEFKIKEAEDEFDRQEMTNEAVQEMLKYGKSYRSWIIFCITVEHAEHVRDTLREWDIPAETVSEKTPDGERARILRDFKEGRIKAVTNVNVLTTGFDNPNIDMLVMLRPTMSPGLYIQMIGRATRPVYGEGWDMTTPEGRCNAITNGPKPIALILDFSGNCERHGPVTHVRIPHGGKRKQREERDGKICISCRNVCPFEAEECESCGHKFEGTTRKIRHSTVASGHKVMSEEPIITEVPVWLDVFEISYARHQKMGSPDSMRVDYDCGSNKVSEWVCPGHQGFAKSKADSWWLSRGGMIPPPASAEEALKRLPELDKMITTKIKVKKEDRYQRITSYQIDTLSDIERQMVG